MVSKREWRWVLVVGAVALALTSVPYVFGLALETRERLFGGFVYAVEDVYSYVAKMRQGAGGAWLFHIPYTPEPHPGSLIYSFYLLLGKVAALLPGSDLTASLVLTYHGARLAFGLGLLLTVYRFLAALTADVAVRRLAFLLVTFGGGLGWLLVALGESEWLGSLPLDLILPEGFTFLVLYAFPHIALARTLLLWGVLFVLAAWEQGPMVEARGPRLDVSGDRTAGQRARYALFAGTTWLAMGLIVPFYVPVAWAVTAATWVALVLRRSGPVAGRLRDCWREAGLASVSASLSAPIVAYSAWVFVTEPVYASWAAQNRILSPHPLHYLVAFGLPLLPAMLAAPQVWREKGPGWVALAWVGVVPLLVYLPFNAQRRLLEGVQVPLCLLAARGVQELQRLRAGVSRTAVSVALLAALVPTNGLLVGGNSLVLLSRPGPIFRDGAEVAALEWLGDHAQPDDVVLASYETGNYLPVRVGARVFVGHGPETVRFGEKRALVARFFAGATEDIWRQDLLAEYGVDWVFFGPAERALGGFDPRTVPYLDAVYRGEAYTVLRVSGREAGSGPRAPGNARQ